MILLRHIGMTVSDLDKILPFYRDVLGFKIKRAALEKGQFIDKLSSLKKVKVKTVKLADANGNLIELLCYQSHPCKAKKIMICEAGYTHIALTVSNLDREYKRLLKKGIKFNWQPQVSPDAKAKVVFCRDPEGNLIELVEEIK